MKFFFKPSTIVFTAEKDQLTAFEQQYPQLQAIIKGLLRSYEGIFDFAASINEMQLAKFIEKKLPDVLNELQQLHQSGIIAYSPRKDKPQVTLLQNRMYADSFILNLSDYLKRKQNFEKRIQAITKYAQQTIMCRSRMIAAYFNDPGVKPCGICDNCINQNDLVISMEEFEMIAGEIFQHLSLHPLMPKDLIKKLTGIKKEKFWKVINYLQSEKKINVTKTGEIEKI